MPRDGETTHFRSVCTLVKVAGRSVGARGPAPKRIQSANSGVIVGSLMAMTTSSSIKVKAPAFASFARLNIFMNLNPRAAEIITGT